jgi:hypothetical protein
MTIPPVDQTSAARNTAELRRIFEDVESPYGDLTVVDRDNRIDISSEYPLSDQADVNTAGVSHIDSDSKYRLRANASTESLTTLDTLQYTPGYVAEIGIALQIPNAPTGDQEVRWGYWDGDTGVYFGWDSDGVFVESQRNGTRQGKVRESDWSNNPRIDPEASLSKGTISRLKLALYNYGAITFQLFENSDETNELKGDTVHYQDNNSDTTLAHQDLPIRVEVDNPDSTDFDVFVADRQATVRGQFTAQRRIKGERRTGVSLSGTTYVPIISFRRKDKYDTINTRLFNIATKADTDIYLQLRSNAGSTTDADYATPQDVNADETAVEVDTSPSGSIGDGNYIFQTIVEGGNKNSSTLGGLENVDLELKKKRPITVFVRTVSGTGGTLDSFSINWAEDW